MIWFGCTFSKAPNSDYPNTFIRLRMRNEERDELIRTYRSKTVRGNAFPVFDETFAFGPFSDDYHLQKEPNNLDDVTIELGFWYHEEDWSGQLLGESLHPSSFYS